MSKQAYVLFAALLGMASVPRVYGQNTDSVLVGTIYVSKYPSEDRQIFTDDSKARVAQFPGGRWALKKFIRKNRQPFWRDRFRTKNDYVLLYVDVDTSGKLSAPQFVHWPRNTYRDEALRLVSLMPAWEPALDPAGKKQPSRVSVKIPFPGYRIGKK